MEEKRSQYTSNMTLAALITNWKCITIAENNAWKLLSLSYNAEKSLGNIFSPEVLFFFTFFFSYSVDGSLVRVMLRGWGQVITAFFIVWFLLLAHHFITFARRTDCHVVVVAVVVNVWSFRRYTVALYIIFISFHSIGPSHICCFCFMHISSNTPKSKWSSEWRKLCIFANRKIHHLKFCYLLQIIPCTT